jgi:hypothetical protein
MFSVFCKRLLYGSACRRHNPREYQNVDMGGPRPQECPGTGIDGCAGCQDVVDQHHTPSGDIGPVFGWHAEGALDIVGPLGF